MYFCTVMHLCMFSSKLSNLHLSSVHNSDSNNDIQRNDLVMSPVHICTGKVIPYRLLYSKPIEKMAGFRPAIFFRRACLTTSSLSGTTIYRNLRLHFKPFRSQFLGHFGPVLSHLKVSLGPLTVLLSFFKESKALLALRIIFFEDTSCLYIHCRRLLALLEIHDKRNSCKKLKHLEQSTL